VAQSPGDEYRARAEARRATLATLNRRDLTISQLRIAAFGAIVGLGILGFRGTASYWWMAVPIVAFIVLIKRHDLVIRARDRAARAVAFYEHGLARLEDRWTGLGETGERFADDTHLYANDLDLFGPASLFQLLSIARTQSGEETLAAWLKAPASREELLARHDAVRELTPRLDLREALALAGDGVRAGVHTEALIAWGVRPSPLKPPALRWIAGALTVAAIAAAVPLVRSGDFAPLLLVLIVEGVLRARQRADLDTVLHSAVGYVRELAVLRDLLARLEREKFECAKLKTVQQRINSGAIAGSIAIRRLERLVEAHDWEHNIVFMVVAAPLMWSVHIGWLIEDWRRDHGRDIAGWLQAVGELEALSSLATYAYEHPGDPFPTLLEPAPQERLGQLDATALGHPLLPSARMIRNDVHLSGEHRLLVVSGSNMSGKSTLLRTVGINVVLALAGAPVRAASFTLVPLAIGATLRIQDSLLEGRSRFYAEITRIRAIVDVGGRKPLLFLLDELFHGTNSHDRFVGATGVLRSLLDLGAIGLITTHDLALTAIATELAPRAVNVHFEDRFEGGEMLFDYRMKPGPVTRSNALALMRAVGLDVSEAED
jgi:hypothetical protein